jgi:hypothetical protein
MPLTPLSTPFTTEYKPLGLEAFAEPLSKMKEKFDVTKSEIDKTKYALSRMSQDDERAKKLLADLDAKTQELSQNLTRSGNYRVATQQLQDLNEWFNTNPEFAGMKQNYNNYQKNYALMQKKLEKREITQDDFETWDYYVRNKFSGTNYDPTTGNYSTGNFTPKSENREKEIEDLVLKIAAMEEDQQVNAIMGINSAVDAGEIRQQLTKYRTKEDAARSIRNFITTGERFKNWKQEDAQMKFFELNDRTKKAALQGLTEDKDPYQFSRNVLIESLPELEELHDQVTKVIANPNATSEDIAKAKEIQAEAEEKMADIQTMLENNDVEAIEQEAAGIYVADKLGYFDKIALAGADIVDFINEGAISSSGSGRKSTKIKEANEVGDIATQLNPVNVMKETPLAGGTSPFNAEENIQLEPVEYTISATGADGETYEKVVEIEPSSSIGAMYQKNVDVLTPFVGGVSKYTTGDGTVSYAQTSDYILTVHAENEALSKTTLGFEQMYDQRIATLTDDINAYKVELLDPTLTEEQEAELEAKIKDARKEKYQATYSKVGQLKDLDFLVTEYINDKSEEELVQIIKDQAGDLNLSDEDIIKDITKLKEDFEANTVSSPKFLDKELNSLIGTRKQEKNELVKNLDNEFKDLMDEAARQFMGKETSELTEAEQEQLELYVSGRMDQQEEGYENIPEEVKAERQRIFERLNAIDGEMDSALDMVDNVFSPGELLLNKIYKEYRKSKTLGSEQFYQIPQIIVDKGADKFSSGQFKALVDDGMVARGSRNSRVIWDPSTRQSIAMDPGGLKHSYTLDAYRTDTPRFAGVDQNGNVIMAFYRKSALTDQNQNLKDWQSYIDKGIQPLAETTQKRLEAYEAGEDVRVKFSKQELEAMQKNNPEVLYLSSEGLDYKPIETVTENFVDYIESANAIANPDNRIEFIEKQRANYAPFYMASNPKAAREYNQFANTLQYRANNGIESSISQGATKPAQSPPYTDAQGREVQKEYQATFQTTADKEILVQYTEVIRDANNYDNIISTDELPALTISNQVNLPTALAKLDLTFGTGADLNLTYTAKGGRRQPLVLAFMVDSDVYRDPRRMQNIIK